MKFHVLLFVFASTVLPAPVFWGHPNVQSNLDAPDLPLGQVFDLYLPDLASQNPQNQIWFTGGLVGYFANEWRAPIWSTPSATQNFNLDDPETTGVGLQVNPPTDQGSPIFDPPDPLRPILRQYIPPEGPPYLHPPSLETPHYDDLPENQPPGDPEKLPSVYTPPQHVTDPVLVSTVPEPHFMGVLALMLATVAGVHIRAKRRR